MHGLIPEHPKQDFIRCGNLRDAIFLGDFHPPPTYEVLEESLIQSCERFEGALNANGWPLWERSSVDSGQLSLWKLDKQVSEKERDEQMMASDVQKTGCCV